MASTCSGSGESRLKNFAGKDLQHEMIKRKTQLQIHREHRRKSSTPQRANMAQFPNGFVNDHYYFDPWNQFCEEQRAACSFVYQEDTTFGLGGPSCGNNGVSPSEQEQPLFWPYNYNQQRRWQGPAVWNHTSSNYNNQWPQQPQNHNPWQAANEQPGNFPWQPPVNPCQTNNPFSLQWKPEPISPTTEEIIQSLLADIPGTQPDGGAMPGDTSMLTSPMEVNPIQSFLNGERNLSWLFPSLIIFGFFPRNILSAHKNHNPVNPF